MKKAFLFLLATGFSFAVRCQTIPDSLLRKYDTAKTFKEKGQVLSIYIPSLKGTPPEQLKILFPMLSYFTNKKDQAGIGYTQLYMGILFVKSSDPNEALKYGISALKIFEEVQDTFALLKTYTVIGNSYLSSGNFEESLSDFKQGLPAARIFDPHYYSIYLNGIADCYNGLQLPDSAMPYIQEALRIAYQRKDSASISSCLSAMGDMYISTGQNEIARPFFRQSISYLKNTNSFYYMYRASLGSNLNRIAQSFFNTAQYDSSLAYARQALQYDYPDFLIFAQYSYELIYNNFDKENKKDSSNKYFRLATEIRDSVLSLEKSKNIQAQHYREEIRQHEAETQKADLAARHRQNIENALIAIGILSFTLLFLLMSRSFITSERLIRFLCVLALLLVFEFINILIHSYLEELTNHSQVLILGILVGIAALLIPLHHRLEKWVVFRLIRKNKEVRLAAARATIQKLDTGG